MVNSDSDLHSIFSDTHRVPVQVLDTQLQQMGSKMVPMGRVRWKGLPPQWTTRENINALRVQFPDFSVDTSLTGELLVAG